MENLAFYHLEVDKSKLRTAVASLTDADVLSINPLSEEVCTLARVTISW